MSVRSYPVRKGCMKMQSDVDRKYQSYIFNNTADAICVTNKSGVLLFTNPAAEKLLGISAYDKKEQRIWEAIPFVETNDELIQMFIDAIGSKETLRQAFVDYENPQHKIFKLRVCMLYTQENKEQFVIVINDLTEFVKVNSALERYTSPEIADYVLHSEQGKMLGGDSRLVTTLMSDLRGFTAMSTKLTPTQLITVLNKYFEKMVSVIEENHGTVVGFLGDGMLVLFGAPEHDPDHADHAVACAIEMQNAMPAVNEVNRSEGMPELEMGIGINSGIAVVGNIGSSQRMSYGCIGETVNLTGRVEGLTVGGQVFVTEHTAKLVNEELVVSGEQSFLPKGAKEPLRIYNAEGLGKKYRLAAADHVIRWTDAAIPELVTLYKLEGKTVDDTEYTAKVLKLSKDTRYALVSTQIHLHTSQNVMLDIGENIYAKVMGHIEKDSILCFTSRPDSFAAWADKLMGK